MLATMDATTAFEAPAPASMIACEGASPSLMAPKIPERRSDRVTSSPASNGPDLIRVQSSGENFAERSSLGSLMSARMRPRCLNVKHLRKSPLTGCALSGVADRVLQDPAPYQSAN